MAKEKKQAKKSRKQKKSSPGIVDNVSGQGFMFGFATLLVVAALTLSIIALCIGSWGAWKKNKENYMTFGLNGYCMKYNDDIKDYTADLAAEAQVGISRGLRNGCNSYRQMDKYAYPWYFMSYWPLNIGAIGFYVGLALLPAGGLWTGSYAAVADKGGPKSFLCTLPLLFATIGFILTVSLHSYFVSPLGESSKNNISVGMGTSKLLMIFAIVCSGLSVVTAAFAVLQGSAKDDDEDWDDGEDPPPRPDEIRPPPNAVAPPGFDRPPPQQRIPQQGAPPPGFAQPNVTIHIQEGGGPPPGMMGGGAPPNYY
uniref:Uncharacterized protein n=1 Tax=Chromera velia CCMP2878 TaxID=1169474 RepID=A0A0G4GA73_9ALVE|eukprot:Cvel_4391.t1-p1 / transcript=Cvel_4391.t1 / gene=Cvel_4391 / organism=Chromera_velia_CCMP2878 / gene_product=hypothetical protein / transcript_product=hypothetical protein / location=Cvel_scaffold190:110881-111810(+) / protein_length=310 / sequence_SO=supercontig / SO=protein_coding / is_pseudo=false